MAMTVESHQPIPLVTTPGFKPPRFAMLSAMQLCSRWASVLWPEWAAWPEYTKTTYSATVFLEIMEMPICFI